MNLSKSWCKYTCVLYNLCYFCGIALAGIDVDVVLGCLLGGRRARWCWTKMKAQSLLVLS